MMKTDTIILKPEAGLGSKPPSVSRLLAILGAWIAVAFLLLGTLTAVAGNLTNSGFRFATSVFTVAESNPMAVLQVLRASPALRSMTVDYYTEPSTASPGTDYTPVSGTLQFQPTDAFKEIRIPILNDGIRELTESFLVMLTNASPGEVLGLRSFISVNIQDNDPGFAFANSSYSTVEGTGEINISVNRGTDLPGAVTVDYSTLPGTATPDVDYVPVAGTLTFSENEASKTIRITLIKDGLKESNETFSLILSNPSAGTALGTRAKATVTIQDDDPGFSFGASSYDVSETGTEVVLTVNRGTDTPGEISVDYFSEPLTATADIDYIPVKGTLTFKPEESFKPIVVPIINDGFKEPVQTFRVVLTNASSGTAISALSKTTVRILDNDLGFRFESTSYVVSESAGEAVLYVNRGSDSLETNSVDYLTLPETATPDIDYTPVTGTLVFGPGDSNLPIRVPIINDGLREPQESFRVQLLNPSAGYSLGSPSIISVRIQDNELGFGFDCTPGDPFCASPLESNGSAKMDVVIFGDFILTNSVSVDFATEPLSAKPDVDYISTSGTLTFIPGQLRRTISIPLVNDGIFEPVKTFRIRLSNPQGMALGGAPTTIINIQDNDLGYMIEPGSDAGEWIVREKNGDIPVNVYRQGDFNFSSSVDFKISSDTSNPTSAVDGKDFIAASGRLNFEPGETNKTITLHLLDDNVIEPRKTLYITLSNPTGGIRLAESSREIFIEDNEANPLRVDPDFNPEVRYASGSKFGKYDPTFQALPDGRILMTTQLWRLTGEDGLGIVRLLHNGNLDPNFKMIRVPSLQAISVQTNGQILVSGGPDFTLNDIPVPNLIRLNPDGSIDSQFEARFPQSTNLVLPAIAIQSDGRILLGTEDNRVIRLNQDGSFDSSFQSPPLAGFITRIIVDNTGKVIIAGRSDFGEIDGQQVPGLARLLPNGALDKSFLPTSDYGYVRDLELGADNRLLVEFEGNLTLMRLEETGSIDPTFKPLPSENSGSTLDFFAASTEGDILLAENSESGKTISQVKKDGTPDESFQPGTYTIQYADSWGSSFSLVREPDGDVLLRGVKGINGRQVPGMARLSLNAPVSRIEVKADSAEIFETNGLISLNLVRTGDSSLSLDVNWATEGGTAQPGIDYVSASGRVTFNAGENAEAITLRLFDNPTVNFDKTVRIRFTTESGTALPVGSFKILNKDLGFTTGNPKYFPNGRLLLHASGFRTGTYVRVERSKDLRNWEEFGTLFDEPQIIDSPDNSLPGSHRFYRLYSE